MLEGFAADAEYLGKATDTARSVILNLLNRIIEPIYYLTCKQIKIGLGSAIYKGKNKPITNSKS